jgi:nucleotide-binding universal stress UspA family protein
MPAVPRLARPAATWGGELLNRLLVATDFSEASQEVVRYGLALTTAMEGDRLLLHVVEGDPVYTDTVAGLSDRFAGALDFTGDVARVAVPPQLISRDLCEEAHWKLSALLPAGSRDRVRALVTVGKAADEIVRVAREQHADLIIMGTHGRRGLRHLLGSSVGAKVSRKASVPVITVDATHGDLLHPAGLRAPYRRSDSGSASANHDKECGGSKIADPACVLATAHTEEAR